MKLFSWEYINKKWGDSGFQKYFQNASWMFGTRIISMAISFLATIYIARNLGPTNFGQLSYALSFISLFGFVASLGIDGIVYRDLIRRREDRLSILGTAFSTKLLAGAIASILCMIVAVFLAADDVSKILIFILAATFILNPIQIILFEFQSRADSKYPSIIALATTVTLNILKIAIVASGKGVIYLALALLFESVLYAIFYLFIYQTKTGDSVFRWNFDSEYVGRLLKDSAPLMVLSAFSMIYARIDQVFIKHLMDAASVGLYDSAVRIAEVWAFIPGIIVAAVYPAIVNAKMVSEDLYNKRLGRLATLLFVVAIGIALPVSLLAPYIVYLLYGAAFAGGITVLKIYVWANIGTFLGILASQYLVTENLRKILTFIAFVPMACNVLLNILWIPQYGIVGAAYATLVSYTLSPLMLLLFKKTRERLADIYRSLRQNKVAFQ